MWLLNKNNIKYKLKIYFKPEKINGHKIIRGKEIK